MLAGILGGSGNHVVQIIIGIVVAAALIGYFLLRVGVESAAVTSAPLQQLAANMTAT